MDDLTYYCVEKREETSRTTFTFHRTAWVVLSGDATDPDVEDVHWSKPGAQPFPDHEEQIKIIALDEDEYEVGRHYAFTPHGPLSTPDEDDS